MLEMHPALQLVSATPEVSLKANHNIAVLKELLSHCRYSYPQAGERYWSTRVWMLLIWQPAYIAIAAVHGMHKSVDFSCLQQSVSKASVHGFFLKYSDSMNDFSLSSSAENRGFSKGWGLVLGTAESLRKLVDGLFSELSSICKLNRTNSYGLVADALLNGLMALARVLPDFGGEQAVLLGRLWCHLMNLENRHGVAVSHLEFESFKAEAVETVLVLRRKSCCRHLLVEPDNLCISCPHLKRNS